MSAAPVQEATIDILTQNLVSVTVLSPIVLPGLLDTWMTLHKDMLCISSVVFNDGVLDHSRLPGEFFPSMKFQNGRCRLENITG